MPFTILMSIVTVAEAGITFDACAPVRELAMPRMLSDGTVINSFSVRGPPSVPSPSDASVQRRSRVLQRAPASPRSKRFDVVVEMVNEYAAVVIFHGSKQPCE